MNLVDFPPELVERIFEAIAHSRDFKRVMRLRIVSHWFKSFIDDTIFRLRLLHHDTPEAWHRMRSKWHTMRPTDERIHPEWYSYVYRYLAYHAWREPDPESMPGRIRRAAVVISEQAGDAEPPAIMARLQSLCRLASRTNGDRAQRAHLLSWVRRSPWIEPGSAEDLEDDLLVAAAHLGCRPFVSSRVFGRPWDAAVLAGDVPMLRLLLSANPDYNPDGPLDPRVVSPTLSFAARCGQRDVYEFAFDNQPKPRKVALEEYEIEELRFPDQYEQAIDIWPVSIADEMSTLCKKARYGHVDMVKHLLKQGVYPKREQQGGIESYYDEPYKILMNAVEYGNAKTVRLLLKHGADPNRFYPTRSPLMVAARKGWLAVAEALLAAGTDADAGSPPPVVLAVLKEDMDMFRLLRRYGSRLDTPESGGWAMSLATLWGLESMMEVLEREVVGRDVILRRCGTDDKGSLDQFLYDWPDEEL
ncbi:ankyrin repeat protein [Apiospora aurea]|uniref:Ankyrin repeat protein n=1 Tax=Apiospora aurea TaxID=335848 RepID=A0ABR1R169_9PEZI